MCKFENSNYENGRIKITYFLFENYRSDIPHVRIISFLNLLFVKKSYSSFKLNIIFNGLSPDHPQTNQISGFMQKMKEKLHFFLSFIDTIFCILLNWKVFSILCIYLSLIHIWRCRRSTLCRSRWSPYH